MNGTDAQANGKSQTSVETGPSGYQEEQPVELVDKSRLSEELKGWLRAREEANRYNRNLLQYAAGVAAAFGVGAGSGGILAVSNALTQDGIGALEIASFLFWVFGSVFTLSYLSMVIAAILAVLLVFAFFRRRAAEKEVTTHLENLIVLLPYHFLPAKEDVVQGLAGR